MGRYKQEGIMNMVVIRNSVAASALLAILATGSAFAQQPQQRTQRQQMQQQQRSGATTRVKQRKMKDMSRMVTAKIDFLLQNREQLLLGEEQISRLQEIRQEFQQDTSTVDDRLRRVKCDLKTVFEADEFDAGQARNLMTQYFDLKQEIAMAGIDTADQVYQVLTTAQLDQFSQLWQQEYDMKDMWTCDQPPTEQQQNQQQ
jgi:hypothetical protein